MNFFLTSKIKKHVISQATTFGNRKINKRQKILKMFQILEDGNAIAPEESLEGRTRVVLLLLPAHPLSIPTKLRFT